MLEFLSILVVSIHQKLNTLTHWAKKKRPGASETVGGQILFENQNIQRTEPFLLHTLNPADASGRDRDRSRRRNIKQYCCVYTSIVIINAVQCTEYIVHTATIYYMKENVCFGLQLAMIIVRIKLHYRAYSVLYTQDGKFDVPAADECTALIL